MKKHEMQEAIRAKLQEIVEFSYSDGCVLFRTEICNEQESKNLDKSAILDSISRVLSEDLAQKMGL